MNIKNFKIFIIFVTAFTVSSALADPVVAIPRASITPSDMGIIIVAGDATSEAIGTYYQQARGIPAANVVRITFPAGSGLGFNSISATQFATIKSQVDAALPSNVQATLITWTKPFKVQGTCGMSITSAFALGYANKYCDNTGGLAPFSPYYDSDSTRPWQDYGIRPSMMLGADSFASAKVLIDRGVSADSTYPVGDGYVIRTTDSDRSKRYTDFELLPALWNYSGGLNISYINNQFNAAGSDFISNKNPVLFYFTGLTTVPSLNSNTYIPGAVGDHMTSFGGSLAGTGQMTAIKWLEAGATGSFGTVEEPGADVKKFPKASIMIDQYFRGATIIEAYWKSVMTPGQGLFVGEPLAKPFTDLPSSTIESNEYVLNTRSLRRNTQYSIQFRQNSTSPWINHYSFLTASPDQNEYRAPTASSSATELRLTKAPPPCPSAVDVVETVPDNTNLSNFSKSVIIYSLGNDSETAQGGRPQVVYYQKAVSNTISNNSIIPSGCDKNMRVNLTVPSLPYGITASVSLSNLTLKPGELAIILIRVEVPETAALTNEIVENISVNIADAQTGQSYLSEPVTFKLLAANDSQAPLLRIKRPSASWYLADYPERTSQYAFPLEADARPDSGITSVTYQLQAIQLDDGSNPAQSLSYFATPTQDETLSSRLFINKSKSGTYRLKVLGYDDNNVLVATSEVDLFSDINVNTIIGSVMPNTLTGTISNDIIKGFQSADTMTGGAGQDIYVYNTITEGLDIINDFIPGQDRIDLSPLFANLWGVNPYPILKQLVRVVSMPTGSQVQVRRNLGEQYIPLATLLGVPVTAVNLDRDLQLAPRTHIFAP